MLILLVALNTLVFSDYTESQTYHDLIEVRTMSQSLINAPLEQRAELVKGLGQRLSSVYKVANKEYVEGLLSPADAGLLHISLNRAVAEGMSSVRQFESALDLLVHAQRLARDSSEELQVLQQKGYYLESLKQYELAIEAFQELLAHPSFANLSMMSKRNYKSLYKIIGDSHLKLGDEKSAAQAYQSYFEAQQELGFMVRSQDPALWGLYMSLARRHGLETGKPSLLEHGRKLSSLVHKKQPLPADDQLRHNSEWAETKIVIGLNFEQYFHQAN